MIKEPHGGRHEGGVRKNKLTEVHRMEMREVSLGASVSRMWSEQNHARECYLPFIC